MGAQVEPSIEEYLRERLMPVEGVIPFLPEALEATFSSILTFNSATTLTLASHVPSSSRSSTWSLFPKARFRETRWMSMCGG